MLFELKHMLICITNVYYFYIMTHYKFNIDKIKFKSCAAIFLIDKRMMFLHCINYHILLDFSYMNTIVSTGKNKREWNIEIVITATLL